MEIMIPMLVKMLKVEIPVINVVIVMASLLINATVYMYINKQLVFSSLWLSLSLLLLLLLLLLLFHGPVTITITITITILLLIVVIIIMIIIIAITL